MFGLHVLELARDCNIISLNEMLLQLWNWINFIYDQWSIYLRIPRLWLVNFLKDAQIITSRCVSSDAQILFSLLPSWLDDFSSQQNNKNSKYSTKNLSTA